MSKGAPKPPAPIDPRVQIAAEANARPSVYSPFGSSVYSGDPNTPGSFRQDVTLSPAEQSLYEGRTNVAQALLGRSSDAMSRLPIGYNFRGAEDPTANRLFMNKKKFLDTMFDRDEERERQRLANQGLPEGSEAFTEAFDDFGRRKADAYDSAAEDSLSEGFRQDIAERQQNYNEVAAALGGAQLSPVGGGSPIDTSGAFANQQAGQNRQYQGELAGYQGDVGMTNAGISAAAVIAAAFI